MAYDWLNGHLAGNWHRRGDKNGVIHSGTVCESTAAGFI